MRDLPAECGSNYWYGIHTHDKTVYFRDDVFGNPLLGMLIAVAQAYSEAEEELDRRVRRFDTYLCPERCEKGVAFYVKRVLPPRFKDETNVFDEPVGVTIRARIQWRLFRICMPEEEFNPADWIELVEHRIDDWEYAEERFPHEEMLEYSRTERED